VIVWQHYPKNARIPDSLCEIVEIFKNCEAQISSENKGLISNEVLEVITPSLIKLGYVVEMGKKTHEKIRVPVTYKERGEPDLTFEADAYHSENRIVLEVEAGRAVANNQFLKDLFQACMMENVDYLCIAVRKIYRGHKDYDKVINFIEALYISGRLTLPLKGILIVGY